MASAVYNRDWPKVRLQILERDRWLCQIRRPGCTVKATDVDHIIAVAEGGSHRDPRNLRASCQHCNRGRKVRTFVERLPIDPPSHDWG